MSEKKEAIVKIVDPLSKEDVSLISYLAPLSFWEPVTNKSRYASVLRKIGVDNRDPKFVIISPKLEEGQRNLMSLANWENELSVLLNNLPIVGPIYFSYLKLSSQGSNVPLSKQAIYHQKISNRILAAAAKLNS